MTWIYYAGAAFAEIAGCFAFWAWLRLDRSPLWLIPGMAALALFAVLLTKVDSDVAGRAYATYGGAYIVASLIWLFACRRDQGLGGRKNLSEGSILRRNL